MYISTSTYGGIDWHDSYTVYRQLKDKDSYCIEEQMVPDMIAGDIACTYPYVENLKEKVLHALSEESCFRFMMSMNAKTANRWKKAADSVCPHFCRKQGRRLWMRSV